MATLEKIRSKSVLLIIVIGVALLAFIVGDALTNSRNLFGDGTTVAKADGEKIDITEYQRKREDLNRQYEEARQQNPQSVMGIDTQQLSQMALDQLIDERLLDKAADKLGFNVNGDLLRYYMIVQPLSPRMQELMQALQQNRIAASSPAQAYEIIFNPKRNGYTDQQMAPFQQNWIAIENETKNLIKRNLYGEMLMGSVMANDLEKKAIYNEEVNTKQLRMAYKPYGDLDEKKYPVSDKEISAEYDRVKNVYKVTEPSKWLAYIAYQVEPSQADKDAAKALGQKVLASVKTESKLNKELQKAGVASSSMEMRESDIPASFRAFVTSAPADSTAMVQMTDRNFTVIRMHGKTAEVDSIQLNTIAITDKGQVEKVLAALNAGAAIDSVAGQFKIDAQMIQKDQWQPLYTAQGPVSFDKAILDSLNNNAGRYIIANQNDQATILAQLTNKTAPKDVYKYSQYTYSLNPSTKTVNDAIAKLDKYISSNNDATKFAANAAKNGFTVQEVEVSQSVPAIPGFGSYMPESRQVVRWAMIDGSKGDVSRVYSTRQNPAAPMLYAAAIVDEYEDFVPVTNKEVKKQITDRLRKQKAGDQMVKQYKAAGNNVDAVAAAMGVPANDVPAFRMNQQGGVNDATATGRIAGSKNNVLYVIRGDNGVYAYTINGQKKENFEYNDANMKQAYQRQLKLQPSKMLRGSKKIVNNSYKFEAGE